MVLQRLNVLHGHGFKYHSVHVAPALTPQRGGLTGVPPPQRQKQILASWVRLSNPTSLIAVPASVYSTMGII